MACSKGSSYRAVHNNKGLPQKRRIQSPNLTYHIIELEKEQTKTKVSRRKDVIKGREDINKDFKKQQKKNY